MKENDNAAILLKIERILFEMSEEELLQLKAAASGTQEMFSAQEAGRSAMLKEGKGSQKFAGAGPMEHPDVAAGQATQKTPMR